MAPKIQAKLKALFTTPTLIKIVVIVLIVVFTLFPALFDPVNADWRKVFANFVLTMVIFLASFIAQNTASRTKHVEDAKYKDSEKRHIDEIREIQNKKLSKFHQIYVKYYNKNSKDNYIHDTFNKYEIPMEYYKQDFKIIKRAFKDKKLTAEQKEYLRRNMEAEVRIIGGTSAVSKNIEYECMNYTYVKRIAGANRYETSIKVAENYFDEIDGMVLAYARNFLDGLSAGPLAYVTGSPLILTDSSKNNKLANDYAHKMLPSFSFTIGGSKLITDETLRDMFDLLPEEEILKGFIVSE
jgi:low affinity Fe/Cu permease